LLYRKRNGRRKGGLWWFLIVDRLALALEPFRYYQYGERTVHLDGLQEGLLFGEHRRHLTLGAAMDALIGPVRLPVIEIRLPLLQLSNFLPFNGVFRAWATPDSTFPFRSGSRTLHGRAVTP
jgi:hypothetical protein